MGLRKWAGVVGAAIFGWAMFVAPQMAPVAPSASDSYIFDYNNRVGILVLFFALAGVAVWFRRRPWVLEEPAGEVELPRRLVWRWCGIFTAAWAAVYGLVHGLGGFGESAYLIDRLKMLAEHRAIYRDFEFPYGVLFLYGPWSFMGLGLGAEAAYFVFYLAALLAGVWMLALTLDRLPGPVERRARVFRLLCWFALPAVVSTGLNYTLFRFLPPALGAASVARVAKTGEPIRAMLLCLVWMAASLLVSPEIGLAYGVGMAAYLGWLGIGDQGNRWRWEWLALTGLLLADGALLRVAATQGVFLEMKDFAGGAYSFPIIPSAHILMFFILCGVCAAWAGQRMVARAGGDSRLAVLMVSGGMLVAALGRCDVGHVGFEGVGILIVGLLAISARPSWWRPAAVAFVVVFIALPAMTGVWSYRYLLSKAALTRVFGVAGSGQTALATRLERVMARRVGAAKAKEKMTKIRAGSTLPAAINLRAIYPGWRGVVEAPFGYIPFGFGSYHSPDIDQGSYNGLFGAFTSGSIARKVGELQSHPDRELLLPAAYADRCRVDAVAERRMIQVLFLYPYTRSPQHEVQVLRPLCTWIEQRYTPIDAPRPESFGYGLWRPRTDGVPAN